ncbi:hypothetical protein SAMN04490208_0662 [Pseudomonas poae]|uniref:Uncharacterized protein n=1 Tax=Pseudomonas poae TaxID=200451 RepID=A0ABY0RBR1_9PSED|nr:hypothetical protein SAMN04490208_0662 [Pseudomonas poae]
MDPIIVTVSLATLKSHYLLFIVTIAPYYRDK